MDIRILGPFEVLGEEGPLPLGGRKQRALLALLALTPGRAVPATRLIDDLWGERAPETAPKMVQIHVSQLRKVLPPGLLVTRPPGYQLDVAPEQVDLVRFERGLRAGREALAAGDAAGAATVLREALSLWRGPALAEFTEPFAAIEAGRLAELHLGAVEECIEADLALGRHGDLVGELDALVASHPLRERLRGQQMRALYRAGRQAEALAAYQAARRTLSDELGIEPSAALRDLERRILQQDPALDVLPATPAPAVPAGVGGPRPVAGLVGRAAELDLLHDHLARVRAGVHRVVLVAGDAGAGKTTLVERFLADIGAEALLGRGQCVEQHGSSEAYMPVLEAIQGVCRAPGGEAALAVLAERAPSWLAQIPWLVPAGEMTALRERTLGTTRDRMLREVVEALEGIATARPVVLALEDLHWSDHSTVELVASLARRPRAGRILLLATYRPADAAAGAHPIGRLAEELAARDLVTRLDLPALGAAEVGEYVRVRLPGVDLPDAVARSVAERTGGNPLFLEKVVDAWTEQGKIRREDGGWALAATGDELGRVVPSSVRQLIRQRVMPLDDGDRRLLEAASVVGPEFSAAAVAAAAAVPEDEAEERLDGLARVGELVAPRGTEEWPDGTLSSRFGFTHDLCHEVLYDDLPAGRRARLHAAAGLRLERAHGRRADEIAPQLAAHFVRGRDAPRAVAYLVAAARQALERHAPVEAIELATRGLSVLDGVADDRARARAEMDLRATMGPALVATRGWSDPDAERAYARAGELARQLGLPDEEAWSALKLGTLYEVRGDYVRSEEIMRRAVERSDHPLDGPALVDSHELLACSLFHQGAFVRAYETAERGLVVYDGISQNEFLAEYGENPGVACHIWAAQSLWHLGRPDAAVSRIERAVAICRERRHHHGLATALSHAAALRQARLEPADALRHADEAIVAATEQGFVYRLGMATVVRGWARAFLGADGEAADEVRRGIEVARATGARMDDAWFLGLLADALLRLGRADEADAVLEDAVGTVPRGGRFFHDAELNRLRGEMLMAAGDAERGEAHLRRALEVARDQGSRSLELRAALSLGGMLRGAGREDEARSLVAGPYSAFTEGLGTPDLRRAAAFLGVAVPEPAA